MIIMKKIILFIAAIILFSSCELVQVLDKKPPYQADLEGAITNPKTVELALNGIYKQLPADGFNVQFPLCAGSFTAGTLDRQSLYTSGNAVYYSERYWPLLSWLGDPDWDYCYSVIKNSNFLLSAVDKIDESAFKGTRKSEIIGELKFLKAFAYSRLLFRYTQFWDNTSKYGLVFREDLPEIGNAQTGRANVEESYKKIFELVDEAILKAPDYSSCEQASKLAAKALKTRVLFMKGEYSQALSLVNEVLPETYLENSYSNIFSETTNSKEVIFAKVFGVSDAEATSVRVSAFGEGKWGPTQKFLDILGDDPRYSTIVQEGLTIVWRNKTYSDLKSVKKYMNSNNSMPIIFFRTAEMLLIKAESIMRSGGSISDAYAPIAQLRGRAGALIDTPSDMDELKEAIFNEWIIELSFENWHEWFAARRFDKLLDLNAKLKEALDKEFEKGQEMGEAYLKRIEDRRIMPIPSSETNSNPVEQNPGY